MRSLTLPQAPGTEIIVVKTSGAVAMEGARRFVVLAREALARRDRFSVALAGGSTPRAMHGLLAGMPMRQEIDWSRVHVFWGDERFVPPDHPDSASLMARETLLNHVPIPEKNLHPMPTMDCTPQEAAHRYALELVEYSGSDRPCLDLVCLGLGPDGHTASLFPGFPQVASPGIELVSVVTDSPKPPPVRLTMTYRILNQANHVVFLADGAAKAKAVRRAFDPAIPATLIPAKGVQPEHGTLTWILDDAAAADLA